MRFLKSPLNLKIQTNGENLDFIMAMVDFAKTLFNYLQKKSKA